MMTVMVMVMKMMLTVYGETFNISTCKQCVSKRGCILEFESKYIWPWLGMCFQSFPLLTYKNNGYDLHWSLSLPACLPAYELWIQLLLVVRGNNNYKKKNVSGIQSMITLNTGANQWWKPLTAVHASFCQISCRSMVTRFRFMHNL